MFCLASNASVVHDVELIQVWRPSPYDEDGAVQDTMPHIDMHNSVIISLAMTSLYLQDQRF